MVVFLTATLIVGSSFYPLSKDFLNQIVVKLVSLIAEMLFGLSYYFVLMIVVCKICILSN